jgi:hypothetical protein
MASTATVQSSICSPPAIAPAPPNLAEDAAKIADTAPISATSLCNLGPTKIWVIPPRPKPGRKPATDTPPTKRKAQNRAAQRAFRERRAARVGELEEQLKETEEERQKRERAMHDQIDEQNGEISRLEEELQRTSADTNLWRDRYLELERHLEHERQEKDAALEELAYLRNGARSTSTDAVPLPPRRPQRQQKIQSIPIPHHAAAVIDPLGCGNCTTTGNCVCVETAITIATSGCGKCTPESHCECLEETLRNTNVDNQSSAGLKRPPYWPRDPFDGKRPSNKHHSERLILRPSSRKPISHYLKTYQVRIIILLLQHLGLEPNLAASVPREHTVYVLSRQNL